MTRVLRSPLFQKSAFVLGALILTVGCVLHQLKGNGMDFFAYYKAGSRLLEGTSFYVDERGYAFKYAPISILYFLPFSLLPYNVARGLYAFLHLAAALGIPWLVWRLIAKDSKLRNTPREVWFVATVVAFFGTLRFIDNEFLDSNVGLIMTAAILGSCHLMTWAHRQSKAPLALGLAIVVKIHALIAFLTFSLRDRRTRRAVIITALILFLIPNPFWWFSWWEQMQVTAKYNIYSAENFNLQGFVPAANIFFGMDPKSLLTLVVALPLGIAGFFLLPRFTLAQAGVQPARFFLTLGCWVLFALLCSPLPWQHTYTILWALIPVAWCASSLRGRWVLTALCLFLALTPKDLVGPLYATLESHQSIFFAILGIWTTCVIAARR